MVNPSKEVFLIIIVILNASPLIGFITVTTLLVESKEAL